MKFFGRDACTAKGMARLVAATGAAVVPMYLARAQGGMFDLHLEPAVPPASTGSKLQDEWQNTQNYTRALRRSYAGTRSSGSGSIGAGSSSTTAPGRARSRDATPGPHATPAHPGARHQLGGRRGDEPAGPGGPAPGLSPGRAGGVGPALGGGGVPGAALCIAGAPTGGGWRAQVRLGTPAGRRWAQGGRLRLGGAFAKRHRGGLYRLVGPHPGAHRFQQRRPRLAAHPLGAAYQVHAPGARDVVLSLDAAGAGLLDQDPRPRGCARGCG